MRCWVLSLTTMPTPLPVQVQAALSVGRFSGVSKLRKSGYLRHHPGRAGTVDLEQT
jgi:hypothetical protein